MGLFERGSHRLVHIPDCAVHHPSIQALLEPLQRLIEDARVAPYDEYAHRGVLRAVQLAVEPHTGGVQIVLLVRDGLDAGVPRELAPVLERIGELPNVRGLFLGALPHKTNALQAERFVYVSGPSTIVGEAGGVRQFYPPGAFGQANPRLHARAIEEIYAFVPSSSRVVEYYAGVGTIGLGLAARGNRLVCNELGPGSLEGLELGRAALGLKDAELAILRGKAGDFSGEYRTSDVVIVDPPRKGLDAALLRRLVEEPPHQLIYLSCGIEALHRESEGLVEVGAYEAAAITGYAYFPYTDHVETLLVLTRRG